METQFFLPDATGVRCDAFRIGVGIVTFEVSDIEPAAPCPDYGQPSRRIHSHYTRILADLPWMGTPAQIRLSFSFV
jgi:transposase